MESEVPRYLERAEELLPNIPLLREWHECRCENGDEKRAFIVEFAGMPKAGKSSAIENLRHFFSHGCRVEVRGTKEYFNAPAHRYEVYTPAEGVSLRTPGVLKSNAVDYNTWAGAYGVQELLQAAHDTHNDLVLLDRGPWDAGCWLQYWRDHQDSKDDVQEDVASIADFFQHRRWMTHSDFHVVLIVDPANAKEREQSSRLIQHGGFASNSTAMGKMYEIYRGSFDLLKNEKAKKCPHVGDNAALLLDTTSQKQQEITLNIIAHVFTILRIKIEASIQDWSFSAEWLQDQIDGYLPKVAAPRKKMTEFLPQFAIQANSLTGVQRFRLKKLIQQSKAPPDFNLAARAPDNISEGNPVERSLRELLRKATQA